MASKFDSQLTVNGIRLLAVYGFTYIGCFSLNITGQTPAIPTRTPDRPREIVRLLNDARSAAPEISADTFLNAASSKKITEPLWRREMLEEALRISDEVKHRVRYKVFPLSGVSVDTSSGYLSYAYDLKLDGLSLKSRVIRQLVTGEKERAKQVVFEIGGRLGLKPLKCEDTMVYDVADIYGAVGAVAKAVFTQKEILDGRRALFILPWFENISSPAQIAPALDLLGEMRGSPSEKQMVFAALATAIDRNFNDDRSFTYAIQRDQLVSRIARLVSGTSDEHLKAGLVSAFRGFLLKNLRGTRCKDNEFIDKEKVPDYIAKTNYLFGEKPLTLEDVIYSDISGRAEIIYYWRSPEAIKLQREFRELRSARTIAGEKTGDDEWGIKVDAFVANLNSWKPSDKETEIDVFHQKCVLFQTLTRLLPDGEMKKKGFNNYMSFLGGSPLQKNNFTEWMHYVRLLSAAGPGIFYEIASDSSNPHFRLMVDLKNNGF